MTINERPYNKISDAKYTKYPVLYFIEKGFVTQDILDKVKDFIEKGKNIIVVGKSGSGKTTFLNIFIDVYKGNQLCLTRYDELYPQPLEQEGFQSYYLDVHNADDIPVRMGEKLKNDINKADIVFIDCSPNHNISHSDDMVAVGYILKNYFHIITSIQIDMSDLEKDEINKEMAIAYICSSQGKHRVFNPAYLLHNTEILYVDDWKVRLL